MELRQLRHFVALAEEASFTQAADRELIVQSGLSSSIRSLERAVGSELYVRGSRPVRLTTAGRVLLPAARRVLAEAERGHQLVREVSGVVAGPFTVGLVQVHAPSSSCPFLGWMAEFAQRHPGLDISVRQLDRQRTLAMVAGGELDCAIVTSTPGPVPGLRVVGLTHQPLAMLCRVDHPHSGRGTIGFADLAQERFVDTYAGHETRDLVDEAFAERGLHRKVTCEVTDLSMVFELVRAGLGVALVPDAPGLSLDDLRLVQLEEDGLSHSIDFVVPSGQGASPAAAAFTELVLARRDGSSPA
ncbi:LysR family transcriptional regulator [Lentzea sp. NPDC060358]|uniref:LysR family transcriptional regulator n=1 Tax=Lentzea sp. NPDC060358 TaxID=3347103 RepID=UPI003660CAC7